MTLLVESIFIGIAVGLLAGALGIGGGILAIPVLVYLLGQDPHAATAESLVVVIVTAMAALPSRFKHRQVRLGTGIVFGLCSAAGAFAGTALNAFVDGDVMMYCFAALLLAVAVMMLRNGLKQRREENAALASGASEETLDEQADDHEQKLSWKKLPMFLLVGTFTGVMVGFFGIGGGFAMIPILVLIMGYSIRVAAGTSFIVIAVVSIISLLMRIGTPVQIDWMVALLFAAGSGIGSAVGSPLSNKARASTLTFIFVALLIAVAIYTAIVTAVL
ncbi:MAG: sulfite exporter TauE/SafE family protein [Actinomycetaceae bacterium]|nr:sulfite exporter TauE/SafE family protein [Actinomycetaceae bacterium]MDY5855332.1 sulfite exporter TauE/SafE family protein [Arcanobacterium sp.]